MAEKVIWRIFGGIMILLIMVLAWAVAMNASEQAIVSVTPTVVPSTATPSPVPTINPLKISPIILYNEYIENVLAADLKYKGKVLIVEGAVYRVERQENTGKVDALISDGSNGISVVCLRCFFKEENELVPLEHGDIVTIIGICDGLSNNMVIIEDCTFYSPIKTPSSQL